MGREGSAESHGRSRTAGAGNDFTPARRAPLLTLTAHANTARRPATHTTRTPKTDSSRLHRQLPRTYVPLPRLPANDAAPCITSPTPFTPDKTSTAPGTRRGLRASWRTACRPTRPCPASPPHTRTAPSLLPGRHSSLRPRPSRRVLSPRPAHQARPLPTRRLRAHLSTGRTRHLVLRPGEGEGCPPHRVAPGRHPHHPHRSLSRGRLEVVGQWCSAHHSIHHKPRPTAPVPMP